MKGEVLQSKDTDRGCHRLGLVVLDLLFAFCQCLSSYKHTGVELSLIWTSFLLLLTI